MFLFLLVVGLDLRGKSIIDKLYEEAKQQSSEPQISRCKDATSAKTQLTNLPNKAGPDSKILLIFNHSLIAHNVTTRELIEIIALRHPLSEVVIIDRGNPIRLDISLQQTFIKAE